MQICDSTFTVLLLLFVVFHTTIFVSFLLYVTAVCNEASQSYAVTILPQSELKKCEDEEKRRELEKEIRECDEVMIANLMPGAHSEHYFDPCPMDYGQEKRIVIHMWS